MSDRDRLPEIKQYREQHYVEPHLRWQVDWLIEQAEELACLRDEQTHIDVRIKLEIEVAKAEGPKQDPDAVKAALLEEIEALGSFDVDDGEHDDATVYEVRTAKEIPASAKAPAQRLGLSENLKVLPR